MAPTEEQAQTEAHDDPQFPCEKCDEDTPGEELDEDGLCPVCADDGFGEPERKG